MIGFNLPDGARATALARQLQDMGCAAGAYDFGKPVDLLVLSFDRLACLRERRDDSLPPFIVIDGDDSAASGMTAARLGALDYLPRNTPDALLLARAFDWHAQLKGNEVQTLSIASARVFEQAARVARTDVAVLIGGESGSGKEVLARYIHARSPRRTEAFIAVNCAAIPDNMLEAILFGHEKGAFTGAAESRPGKFEIADKGTLLLDEITEMPLPLQAKLLRVLQEREVERVGARSPRPIDVRVIATTNRDVKAALAEGLLREDLYFRLSVFPLTLPPLRQRTDEIVGLVRHFLRKHSRLVSPRQVMDVAPEVLALFERYPWPGNVRELENVIQRALVLCDGERIENDHVDLGMTALDRQASELAQRMLLAEGETILAALRAKGGKRAATAQALGISERTLRYKLRRLRDLGMEVT